MVTIWVLGDYTNTDEPTFAEARRWIADDHVGGVIMSLGSPIEVAEKINALQRLAPVPLLISSDLEPGLGRLEGGSFTPSLLRAGSATVLPTNMAIGATGRDSNAYEAGRITGREARAIGIQMAFAPVVDVNNNPANPVINVRSFGEDPASVARMSAAFVRGVQSEGVAATAKHFPGHGDTDTDSHLALPIVTSDRQRLDVVELVPFRGAIESGVSGMMTAHIALPAIEGDSTPATLAPRIITGLLRDTLGFRGLAITDALTMEGVGKGYTIERSSVLAVLAGADILLKPSDATKAIDAVLAAVNRGEVTPARIERSARRILEMKARTGAASHPMVNLAVLRDVVASPAHLATASAIAAQAITLVRDSLSLVPLGASRAISVVTYAPELEVQAGRAFAAELRAAIPGARVVRITPRSSRAELDTIAQQLHGSERVIVTTHVRTIEGEGRFAIPATIGAWIDSLATRERVVVVASGNPYVIRQFPRVSSYLVAYGISDVLERAAARALLGLAPISGHTPISLPGFFQRGDGIARAGGVAQEANP
jgi:beta-N-acetylhexosaminidase